MDRYDSEKHYFEGDSGVYSQPVELMKNRVISGGCVCYDPGCRNLQQLEFDLLGRLKRRELQQSV